jgi:hypothetical protein
MLSTATKAQMTIDAPTETRSTGDFQSWNSSVPVRLDARFPASPHINTNLPVHINRGFTSYA